MTLTKTKTGLMTAGVALALLSSHGPAEAFKIVFDPTLDGSRSTEATPTGSTAEVEFTFLDSFNSTNGNFLQLDISNTTPTSITSLLTAVGFNVPTVVSSASLESGGTSLDTLLPNTGTGNNFPSISVNFCLANDNNCQGGNPSSGIPEGGTDTAVISFSLTTVLDAAALEQEFIDLYEATDDFAVARFQSVGLNDQGSDTVTGAFEDDDTVDPGEIPEPATLAVIGTGLVAGGLIGRRRRKA